MKRILFNLLLLTICLSSVLVAKGQSTLRVSTSDGAVNFNGITELKFPSGTVTIRGRTAVVFSTGAGAGGGTIVASQGANNIFAGPIGGSPAAPGFRLMVPDDVPTLDALKIGSGVFPTNRLGTGTANSTTYLRGDGIWSMLPTNGTVTSVGMRAPSIFSVSGSPVTGAGTLTLSLATQAANKVLAGPASGADAPPTMRLLVAADIPSLTASKISDFNTAVDARISYPVSSVFGRTGAVVAATNDYSWGQINKTTSSLADLATRSASDLNTGTLPDTRLPTTLPGTHFKGTSSAPTCTVGAGAGTGASCSVTGTDAGGQISVTPGTSPSASAVLITVTFNSAYATAPFVVFAPSNSKASEEAPAGVALYVTTTTTTCTLNVGATALTLTSAHRWHFIIMQ